jgi:hypothetical protein
MANAMKFVATVKDHQLILKDLAAFEGKQVEVIVTLEESPASEVPAEAPAPKKRRPMGLYRGQFVVPEDFDDPLPPEIQRYFDGEGDPEDLLP